MVRALGEQFGEYRLVRKLGEGGFAEVYEADHVHLPGDKAAIKLLKGSFTPQQVEELRREALIVSKLDHPHIVQLRTFNIEHGTPYLVMAYAQGGSLNQRYPRGTRMTLPEILTYLHPIAVALQYMHEQRVVHRDLKLANLLLTQDGRVQVADFGVAVVAHSSRSRTIQEVAGTYIYMAPEQFRGLAEPASDQYALGIIVYEWLCGEPPFTGNGDIRVLPYQHMSEQPPSLCQRVPTLSPRIEWVVMKALAKEPHDRWPNVQAFSHALEQAFQTKERFLSNPTSLLSSASLHSSPPLSGQSLLAVEGSHAFPYKQIILDQMEDTHWGEKRPVSHIFGGKFKVLKAISEETSIIYKAERNRGLQSLPPGQSPKFYALKGLPEYPAMDEEIREQDKKDFEKEYHLLQTLKHPTLPSFIDCFMDFCRERERYYFVMDFIPGCNLEQVFHKVGNVLDETQLILWMIQICDALEYLYSRTPSIALLKIKPDDILVTTEGDVKLMNVGSRDRFRSGQMVPRRPRRVLLDFSPPVYEAPEVQFLEYRHHRLKGAKDIRSSIYSLGATMYYLLTGEEANSLPPQGSVSAKNPSLKTVQIDKVIVCPIEQVIIKAMQYDPNQRFQTVTEMQKELRSCLSK